MEQEELEAFRKWAKTYAEVGFVQAGLGLKLVACYDNLVDRLSRSECSYCGLVFSEKDSASREKIQEHISHCGKHPMAAVVAENDRLRAELAATIPA